MFRGENGDEYFRQIVQSDAWESLQEQVPGLQYSIRPGEPASIYINEKMDVSDPTTEDQQLAWLLKTTAKFVDQFTLLFDALDRAIGDGDITR